MIERATYDLLRVALRLAIQLWPLWLFWFVWSLFDDAWRDFLLTFPDRSTQAFALAYGGWPAVALLGPILLMGMAIAAFRLGLATRLMPLAGIAGVVAATVLTVWPEYQRLAPYVGSAPLLDVLRALNLSAVQAAAVGLIACGRRCSSDAPANPARQNRTAPGAWTVRQFRPR
jgi:type IV secretion system protein VirD4